MLTDKQTKPWTDKDCASYSTRKRSITTQNQDSSTCRIVDLCGLLPAGTFPLPKAPPPPVTPLQSPAAAAKSASVVEEGLKYFNQISIQI